MDKKSLFICLGLFVLSVLIGCGLCFIFDGLSNDDYIESGNNLNLENEDDDNVDNNNDEIETNDEVSMEIYENKIQYSGIFMDLRDYVAEFNNNLEYKNKLLTLTVDGIMLNEEKYSFSFKNHPQNCNDMVEYMDEDKYNQFYINDKMIYRQNNQACYLQSVRFLTTINDEYIGISFEGQSNNYMNVYNKKLELIDTLKYVNLEISEDGIIYNEFNKDNGCLADYYIYDIVDGKVTKTFKEQLENTVCDMLSGEGCCNN